MKLFTRYFRINLLATVFVFVLASLAFFFLLRYVSIRQVDDDLRIEQREIESYLSKYNKPPEPITVHDQSITFVPSITQGKVHSFQTIKSPQRGDEENFRQLQFTARVADRWLMFNVSKSLEETESLNRSIVFISLATIVAILIVSLLINRWLLQMLWKPFYSTLGGLERFRLGEKMALQFEDSSIYEFNLLNQTVNRFIHDAEKEFFILKEFTENASHELQTPLAVIRSSLDVMMQDDDLSESKSHLLQNAYDATQKMSKLNQSLLLLNKIENRQFAEVNTFDLELLVVKKMTDWQELWQGRDLKVSADLEPVTVSMNEHLAEIMVNNLFSNAARHCAEGGDIRIRLSSKAFEISNTAVSGPLPGDKLFKRFSKASQATDQNGLGLSIVKQIADVSHMQATYAFLNGNHVFTIKFS